MKQMIVGLGNPGIKYEKNRHNAGFIILDSIAAEHKFNFSKDSKFNGEIYTDGVKLYLKPLLFMNNSGEVVAAVANFYKISSEDIFVIHDDVDIPFGELKRQFNSGAAGHHGVESIIKYLGTTEFNRIRIGVGKGKEQGISTEDWVLMNFSDSELEQIKKLGNSLEI